MWFFRFDVYYRPYLDRSLPKAYRRFIVDTRGEGARVSGVPPSWKNSFAKFRWEERAEAWDEAQRLERHAAEAKLREESRTRRLAMLNATMNKTFAALQGLDDKEAKWGDVINAVRMVVQELRQEHGDADESAANGSPTHINAPSWAVHLQALPPGEVDNLIRNLLAGTTKMLPAPAVVEVVEQ